MSRREIVKNLQLILNVFQAALPRKKVGMSVPHVRARLRPQSAEYHRTLATCQPNRTGGDAHPYLSYFGAKIDVITR